MVFLPHLKENMVVNVHITSLGLEIRPVVAKKRKKLPYGEAELLKGLTAKRAHADELIAPSKKELGE